MRKLRLFLYLAILAAIALPWAAAQQEAAQKQPTLSLEQAVSLSLAQLPAITVAQNALAKAQATYDTTAANPASLVTDKTQAKLALAEAKAGMQGARLQALSGAIAAYTGLLDAQAKAKAAQAQLALDQKKLAADQAKYKLGYTTAIVVAQDNNTVQQDAQSLAAAQAQLALAQTQLAQAMGQDTAPSTLQPLNFKAQTFSLDDLKKLAQTSSANLLKANDAVTLAQLQVQLSDNSYTPQATITQNKISLSSAQADLTAAQQSVMLAVTQAYQQAESAAKQVSLTQANLTTAQQQQGATKKQLAAGLVTAIEVDAANLTVQTAENAVGEAIYAYYKALAQLNVAVGEDVAGLLPQAAAAP